MKELKSEIEINAPAEKVWEVLTDFGGFPDWNPFIRMAQGEIREGAKLKIRVQPMGGMGMTLYPTITKVIPNRMLSWFGKFWIPRLFEGEHIFTIEPLKKGRVRFTQREVFNGMLIPLLEYVLDRDILHGFEDMNEAVKTRAEGLISRKSA
jgi:hypothetical protein